ncbi:hypothetical protein DMN91_010575 [Ooceraea biroi]|uniref:Uncharacterized protein n=1 Tax=Ooceraea biroi TaxID=2015173 RepID=A0A3L8D7Q4_OOCBI|nr:hypothetical protein DMN91_010575 [Ooceraea biroi]
MEVVLLRIIDFLQGGRKEACGLTSRSALQKDIQVAGYTADPPGSEPLSAKPIEERSTIVRGLNIIRREINRLGASAVKLFGVKR